MRRSRTRIVEPSLGRSAPVNFSGGWLCLADQHRQELDNLRINVLFEGQVRDSRPVGDLLILPAEMGPGHFVQGSDTPAARVSQSSRHLVRSRGPGRIANAQPCSDGRGMEETLDVGPRQDYHVDGDITVSTDGFIDFTVSTTSSSTVRILPVD
jgi:hypothetical protein